MKNTLIFTGMALFAGVMSAATITFQDGVDGYAGTKDTTLMQNDADGDFGGRNEILLGATGANAQRAGVIAFDVTSMDGIYSSIDSVTIEFTVFRTAATNTWNLNLLREGNAGWVEGTDTAGATVAGTATWNDMASPTDWLGGSSGARLAADIYGAIGSMTFTNGTTVVGTVVQVTLDPTALADTSVDSLTEIFDIWTGGTNAGLQIYGGTGQWGVDSSEGLTVAERPKLIVEYTAVPEPSAYAAIAGFLALSWVMIRRRA